MKKKIEDFTDLLAWKEGHELVKLVYKYTKTFPKDEIYGITNQIRRAAVSVTSNIAEGFGRKGYKEKINFYYHSQGSLIELKNQLIIARDVGYLNKNDYEEIISQARKTHQLLQGLISKSKSILNS